MPRKNQHSGFQVQRWIDDDGRRWNCLRSPLEGGERTLCGIAYNSLLSEDGAEMLDPDVPEKVTCRKCLEILKFCDSVPKSLYGKPKY